MVMFSKEFLELLTEIIKSWQVIAVTVAIIIYLRIISSVAKAYRKPRVKKEKAIKTKKVEPTADAGPEEISGGGDSNDELGLEEA
jgi:flagellar biosynthesis/type III secretory pathway M-ring protein FliF/YscJ